MTGLFFTDLHLAANPPGQRRGDYLGQMLRKLEWVVEEAQKREVDVLAFGGDFINHPAVSLRAVNEAIRILNSWPLKRFVYVLGQHDLIGHSIESLPASPTSLLAWVQGENPWEVNSQTVCWEAPSGELVECLNYSPRISEELVLPIQRVGVSLTLVHYLVGLEFPLDSVFSNSNLVLCGDYHAGFPPTVNKQGILVANPGSLARVSINQYNHQPQVALFETGHKPSVEYLPVPCESPATIFDLGQHEAAKASQEQMSEYVNMLRVVQAEGRALEEEALEEMGLDPEVEQYVQGKLQQAREQSK